MKLNKKLFTDVVIIAAAALALAVAYNLFSDKPLPWFAEEKVYETITDDFFEVDTTPRPAQIAKKAEEIQTESKGSETADTSRAKKTDALPDDILKKNISYQQMKRQTANPNVIIIDARPETLYEAGHIGNAINIHPYWAEDVYMPKLIELPQDKIIIVYCDGGDCDLSHHVAKNLKELGFSKIAIYYGGWAEWVLHK